MKKFAYILCITLSATFCLAQDIIQTDTYRPTNNLYLDLFGGGSIFSVNYEKIFLSRKNSFLNFKLGAGYTQGKSDAVIGKTPKEINVLSLGVYHYEKTTDYSAPTNHLSIPAHLTFNYGMGKHFFEIGVHYTYYLPVKSVVHSYGPLIGYRFHPLKSDKGIFRFYLNIPMEGFNEIHWYSPIGISFGFSA